MDEEAIPRHLRLVAVEIGAALRRHLLHRIEAIAEHERAHPAINWPIEQGSRAEASMFPSGSGRPESGGNAGI